jgi:hypothetical protein
VQENGRKLFLGAGLGCVLAAGCVAAPAPTGGELVGTSAEALGTCGGSQLAVAAATASSVQGSHFLASYAIDGNLTTRWSSNQGMPQWLMLDMGSPVFVSELDIDWQTAYATSFEIQAGNDGTNFGTVIASGASQAGWQSITGLNVVARYIRINATGATGYGNVSIVDTKVIGDTNSACPTTESSCGQSVKVLASNAQASSNEFSYTPASAAIDQNYGTRWSSAHTDNEWLTLDLGSTVRVDSLRIIWQRSYAAQYAIQTGPSMTGPWTTVVNMTNTASGAQTVPNVNASTQYLRLQGIKRATQYGYSLYEIEVYGSRDASCLLPGPWVFDSTDTTMVPATGYWTVTGNSVSVDFSSTSFTWGANGPGLYFQQPASVVQGGTYNFNLNLNVSSAPAIVGAELSGAAPVDGIQSNGGLVTIPFSVTSNPGPNPVITLILSGPFSSFCPSCTGGGVGVATYSAAASLVKTN